MTENITNLNNGTEAPTRILLVEDNIVYISLIRQMLAHAIGNAFILDWASQLKTGLARLAAGDIDLVLLDLSLPDSSGLATFTSLQARAPHLPIIVLTGLDDEKLAIQTVRYPTGECQISPLDLVMLYTDGVYEAENPVAESFGQERLIASASNRILQPAPLLFDGLLADVQQFTGSTQFTDDVCLVGIEIMRVGQSNGGA